MLFLCVCYPVFMFTHQIFIGIFADFPHAQVLSLLIHSFFFGLMASLTFKESLNKAELAPQEFDAIDLDEEEKNFNQAFFKIQLDQKMNLYQKIAIFFSLLIVNVMYFAYLPYYISLDIALYSINIIGTYALLPDFRIKNYSRKHLVVFLVFTLFLPLLNLVSSTSNVKNVALGECYSVWALSKNKYTEKDWTIKTNYSYSLMKELLSTKYNLKSIDHRSDFRETLAQSELLILMTPTIPFNSEEQQVLDDFIKAGGEVVVIADHTDLYGHARTINHSFEKYGLFVRYDALFRPDGTDFPVSFINVPFQRFRTMTGCSVLSNRASYVPVWYPRSISEQANYNKANFFGKLSWTPNDEKGDWPLLLMLRGIRVWTDSTIFSNFAIFLPNTLSLLNLLLEGSEYHTCMNNYFVLCVAAFCFFSFLLKLSRKNFLFFCSMLLLFLSGAFIVRCEDSTNLIPKDKLVKVYGDYKLMQEPQPTKPPIHNNISNFYSNLARYGIYPYFVDQKIDSVEVNDTSLLITTWESFSSFKKSDLLKIDNIIIVDKHQIAENYGFRLTSASVNESVLGLFPLKCENQRQVYVNNQNQHTKTIHGTKIFAAYGLINDRFFGDWWAVTEVSPYRKYLLYAATEWLKQGIPINKYHYPDPIFTTGNITGEYHDSFGNSKEITGIELKLKILEKNSSIVYLGSGLWGIYQRKEDVLYIMGGPETSDDYERTGNMRWFIKYPLR